jgi:hypothetical protein
MQYFAAAASMLLTVEIEARYRKWTAGLLLATHQDATGKGFRLQLHTHQSTTQEKPLCGLLAKLPIRFSVRATVCRTACGSSSWPAWIFQYVQSSPIPLLCQSQKPFLCIGNPPQNLLNSRTTNHRGRRASDRRRSRRARARAEKRNVWNWKACRLPGRYLLYYTKSLHTPSLHLFLA